MRYFLIDLVLSSIFNIALVVFWFAIDFSSQKIDENINVNDSKTSMYDYVDERRLTGSNLIVVDDAVNNQNNVLASLDLASGLRLILMIASLVLLFTNLFTYRRIKKKFKEFKASEAQPRVGIFLGSSEISQMTNSRWNLSHLQNFSQRSTNDYAEVHPTPDEEDYEPINIYRKDICSETYETIYKPESEQYDEINYM